MFDFDEYFWLVTEKFLGYSPSELFVRHLCSRTAFHRLVSTLRQFIITLKSSQNCVRTVISWAVSYTNQVPMSSDVVSVDPLSRGGSLEAQVSMAERLLSQPGHETNLVEVGPRGDIVTQVPANVRRDKNVRPFPLGCYYQALE